MTTNISLDDLIDLCEVAIDADLSYYEGATGVAIDYNFFNKVRHYLLAIKELQK